ncbi:MAG: hypothetical protein ACYSXF_00045 [Planctomycetota bacterium]|jgi:hypothetical protein
MSGSRHGFVAAGNWRVRLILPVAALGLLVAGVGLLIQTTGEAHSVSRVTRSIRDVVLSKPDGGLIGPWLVSAREQDPLTGEFQDFKMESGSMRIAAKTARLAVDPYTDTFSFELWDLVLTRVPDAEDKSADSYLIQMDHHVLGPAPYGADITSDGS